MGRAYGALDSDEMEDEFKDKRFQCDITYQSTKENAARRNWPFGIQGTLALLGAIIGSGLFTKVAESVFLYGPIYLLPYTVCLVLLTVPIFYLEAIMGQFCSSGILTCWPVPIFKSIGVIMFIYNIPCVILQCVDSAQNLYYLHESVHSSVYDTELPWQAFGIMNRTAPECGPFINETKSPNEVYFNCHVLGSVPSDPSAWTVNVPLLMALLIVWMITFLVATFGIKALAWVSTVLVPVGVLILVTLAGIADSLPASRNIWTDAGHVEFWEALFPAIEGALRMFLATSGVVITYSSYNRFHNDVIRDAVYIFVLKYLVDIMMVTALGGFLYHKAFYDGADTTKLTSLRLDAAFVGVHRGVSYSIAFFLMVFIFKILNVLALLETLVTGLQDQFQSLTEFRPLVVLLSCMVLLLLSVPMVTTSGPYLAASLDQGLRSWLPDFLLLLMVVCFTVYGIVTYFRHRHDVAAMTRWHLWCIPSTTVWLACAALLMVLLPLVLVSHLLYVVYYVAMLAPPVDTLRHCLVAMPFLVLIVTAGVQLVRSMLYKNPDWRTLVGLTQSWNPALATHWSRVRRYRDLNPHSSSYYPDQSAPRCTSTPRGKDDKQKIMPFYI